MIGQQWRITKQGGNLKYQFGERKQSEGPLHPVQASGADGKPLQSILKTPKASTSS